MNAGRTVAIFGSSATMTGSAEWMDAEKAGARCAEAGLAVVTGGYGGTMEAASRGAALAGGEVIGVTAPSLFPMRWGANSHVGKEVAASGLAERIGILLDLADGVIVLPGSLGTAAELVVAWNLNHVGKKGGGARRLPTVVVGGAWREFWEFVTDRLGADPDGVHTAPNVDLAVDWLLAQPAMGLNRPQVMEH